MKHIDVNKIINAIIADTWGVEEEEIKDDRKFSELGADSIDAVELIMELEKEFNISIPDDVIERFKNIGEIKEYINKKVNRR